MRISANKKFIFFALAAGARKADIWGLKFNKKVLEESATNKQNYKIGSESLEDEDNISIGSDDQTIIITLEDDLEEGIVESNILISENVLDLNNNKISTYSK